MAEVATAPENRTKLTAGSSLVTPDMVAALEAGIDDLLARFDMPSDFTVPGENRAAAALDLARTVVRRAERIAVAEPREGSLRAGLPQPVVRPPLGHGSLAGRARARAVQGRRRRRATTAHHQRPVDPLGRRSGRSVQRRRPVVVAVGVAEEDRAEQTPAVRDAELAGERVLAPEVAEEAGAEPGVDGARAAPS